MYRVLVEENATEFILSLGKRAQSLLRRKIDSIGENPFSKDSIKIDYKGETMRYIDFSEYRIVYHVKDEVVVVLVLSVSNIKDSEKIKKIIKRIL